jgi:phage terminase large subunit-like protein
MATLDFVAFDEEPPWDIYQEALPRVAAKRGYIMGAMTALKYKTRLVNLIYYTPKEQTGISVYRITLHENHVKNCGCYTDEDISRLINQYDPRDVPARVYGIPTLKSGMVFDNFEDRWPWVLPRSQEFEIPWYWATYEAIDPHPALPHHHLSIAVEPNGRAWVYSAIKFKGSPREAMPQIWQTRRRTNGNYVLPESIRMDAHGGKNYSNAMEQKTYYDEFLEFMEGLITIHVPVELRINLVNSLFKIDPILRTPRMIFFESVEGLRQEVLGYVWESHNSEYMEDRKEQKQVPIKKNDHWIDCLAYIVGGGCPYIRPSGISSSMRVSSRDENKLSPAEVAEGMNVYAT